MKKIILNFEVKSDNFNELVQEAFNKGFLNFLISDETHPEFVNIERIQIYSKSSHLSPDFLVIEEPNEDQLKELANSSPKSNTGVHIDLKTIKDEMRIKQIARINNVDYIIVSAKDWKIIPFENLIADMSSLDTELIASVEDVKEAELMLKTLEIGVDGILMTPKDVNDIETLKDLMTTSHKIDLTKGKILSIKEIPESERVCVDTTSLLHKGEGMLIGSTAKGFALVHAEVFESQFVASRPFRVNAGDVSAYILVPSTDPRQAYRTKYLSELKGGDQVFVVNNKSEARIVSIGRVKIETRPMLRFEIETIINDVKVPINCICQNAETIRLVNPNGNAISVVDIKVGDEILVHIGPGATHFGKAIKETILEK